MPDEVYSVSDITRDIRNTLEGRYGEVWVEGEISNHRLPGSGHHYFTLKDPGAQLSCVFFKGSAARNPTILKDGLQVQIFGDISVYEARGQYQMVARLVQPKGHGDLQAKFEELKRKLDAEGLFDADRKKPIPRFPVTIGIVTSPTGAAIQDILNVLKRRAPWIRVVIQPVRVQGEGAAEEIAAAVRSFEDRDLMPEIDLLMATRGGGSIEDLWSFNEEVVARAIAESTIPVMSGVGHEIDFTIADFVADRREPTPSAAAENAVPDGAVLLRHLEMLAGRIDSAAVDGIGDARFRIHSLWRELSARDPERKVQGWVQTTDYLGERLRSLAERHLEAGRAELDGVSRVLKTIRPEHRLARLSADLELARRQLEKALSDRLSAATERLERTGSLLHSLSPDSILQRGFSMTIKADGSPVSSVKDVKSGDDLVTHLSDGKIESSVD